MNDEVLLNIGEAAEILNIHPETLRRWDNEGILPAIKINDRGDRRWRKSDILAFLRRKGTGGMIVYKGYEVIPHSDGFENFPDRFGAIAKYVIKKEDEYGGFVFAVAGLELVKSEPNKIDLKNLAIDVIKKAIESQQIYDADVYTFELRAGKFVQVFYPEWWEEPLEATLVKGLRVSVGPTHPIKEGVEAWRSVIRFKTKQDGKWLTTPFGPHGRHTEYFVEVTGEYLDDKAKLPPTLRGAAIFSLKYIRKRFDQTMDKDGNRSIERIAENKVACWGGKCIRNTYIPLQSK